MKIIERILFLNKLSQLIWLKFFWFIY